MQSSLGRGDENLWGLFGRATARGHTRKKGEIKRVIKDRHICCDGLAPVSIIAG